LAKAALAHVQFETIHPFLDGSGRLGRLLITFILCMEGVLKEPLLYLSLYFKANRQEYYDHLQSVRETGDWESWIKFFLTGVIDTATQVAETAQASSPYLTLIVPRLKHPENQPQAFCQCISFYNPPHHQYNQNQSGLQHIATNCIAQPGNT
jgi:hypothetical protein